MVGVAARQTDLCSASCLISRPVLGNQLVWNKPQREINQPWDNNNIIQVTQYWNKVGNQIEWHTKIADGETQKYLGAQRSSLVGKNPSIDIQLAFESTCEIFALLPHARILASPSNEQKISYAFPATAGKL
jgi:hypothetical protein